MVIKSGKSIATVSIYDNQVQQVSSQFIPLGSELITAYSNPSTTAVVLPNGVTLTQGEVATISGTVIALAPAGTAMMVGTLVIPLKPVATPMITESVTIGSSVMSLSYLNSPSSGVILPNGDTLLPGSATTVSGTVISLAATPTAVIVGSTTVSLPSNTASVVTASGAVPAATISSSHAKQTGDADKLPLGIKRAIIMVLFVLYLIL
jgi:hypothetical protein